MQDLTDYQQKMANELFILAHTGDRNEARIEIENIMRKQIALEIENYRVNYCRCETKMLPLCEHLLVIQECIILKEK